MNLLDKHLKKLLLVTITIIVTINSLPLFSADEEIQSREYRERLLGNKAFDSGLYDVAMNYYKNYLKDAAGNSPAIRDAYFCLIATCLRSNKLDRAQILFNELKTKFQVFFKNSSKVQMILEYWNAEILLKKGQVEKASKIFENIIQNAPESEKELTINALTGLGATDIRQKNWNAAEENFLKLKELGKGTKTEVIAVDQMVLINVIQGNIDKAKLLLKKNTKDNKILTEQLHLLEVYTLIKEKKLTEALQKYNQLKQTAVLPDSLWYSLAYTFANSYIERKEYKQAEPLLEDASVMAPTLYYKEKAVLTLINTLLASEQSEKLISTATFFLNNFPNTTTKNKILLCLIKTLIKGKKYSEAADCTSKYLTLTIPSTSDKIKIACITGQALLNIKKYDEAMKYFKYAADNGINSIEKGQGKYWCAETVLARAKYEPALKMFKDLQNNNSYWKEKSTYKIAEIYLKQKNYEEAEKALKLLITNYPASKLRPSPVFLYATTLKNTNKTDEAISYFIKYAKDNPANKNTPHAYFEAGVLSLGIGKYTQGINYFQKVLKDYKKTDKTPNVLYYLLYANYLAGNNTNSEKYASRLLKQYPDSELVLQTLLWQVNFYTSIEQYNKVLDTIEVIKKKFAKEPQVISKALYDKAYFLNNIGRNTDALKTLSILENDYSTTTILPKSLYLKGDILSSDGNYIEAISSYLKATQITDNTELIYAAWGRVGDCYFSMINYTKNKKEKNDILLKAVDYYNKIINEKTLSPLFKIQTLYKLGRCYELLNEKEKALTMYHEAIYGSVLNREQGENPNVEWFAKSGIALARLLQDKNSPIAAEAAISVYRTLIKYNIQPIQDFKRRIKIITNNYKLKE